MTHTHFQHRRASLSHSSAQSPAALSQRPTIPPARERHAQSALQPERRIDQQQARAEQLPSGAGVFTQRSARKLARAPCASFGVGARERAGALQRPPPQKHAMPEAVQRRPKACAARWQFSRLLHKADRSAPGRASAAAATARPAPPSRRAGAAARPACRRSNAAKAPRAPRRAIRKRSVRQPARSASAASAGEPG